MKFSKTIIYVLGLSLLVVSGLVFANRNNEPSKKSAPKPIPAKSEAPKKWEETPNGILFKKWEESPAGKKVYASEAKIMHFIKNSTNMEAVVTSLSLPAGSRLGLGMMVKIDGDDYILSFGLEKPGENQFQKLRSLKVNDRILIKSHNVSHAPKYAYPIISGNYVELDGKGLYKRTLQKGGC